MGFVPTLVKDGKYTTTSLFPNCFLVNFEPKLAPGDKKEDDKGIETLTAIQKVLLIQSTTV